MPKERRTIEVGGGKPKKLSRLEIAILSLKALAANGKSAAADLLDGLRVLVMSDGSATAGGYLVVPERLSVAEFLAQIEIDNANKVEPGTAIDVAAQALQKAVRGEPTRYGEALLAYHRKYR